MVFLQSNNKHTEKGVIDTSTLNNIKNYLETNIIKEEDLKKDIEKDMESGKNISCSWIGRINIEKMTILQKLLTNLI